MTGLSSILCNCSDLLNLTDACTLACASVVSGSSYSTCTGDAWSFLYNSNGWLLQHFLYAYHSFMYTQNVGHTLLWVFLYRFLEILLFKIFGFDVLVIQKNPYVSECYINATGYLRTTFAKYQDNFDPMIYKGMWVPNLETQRFVSSTLYHTHNDHWWQWNSGTYTIEDLFLKEPLLAIMGITLAYTHVYLFVWMRHYYHKKWFSFGRTSSNRSMHTPSHIESSVVNTKNDTMIHHPDLDSRFYIVYEDFKLSERKKIETFENVVFFPNYFYYDQISRIHIPTKTISYIKKNLCSDTTTTLPENFNTFQIKMKKKRKEKLITEYKETLENIPYVIKNGLWPPNAILGRKILTQNGQSNYWCFRKLFWYRYIQIILLGTPASVLLGLSAPTVGVGAGIFLYLFFVTSLLVLFYGWNTWNYTDETNYSNITLLYAFWFITVWVTGGIYSIPWSYRFIRILLSFSILFILSCFSIIYITSKTKSTFAKHKIWKYNTFE
jgi:hypothetical protein